MGLAPVSFKNSVIYHSRIYRVINRKIKCLSTVADLVYTIVCLTTYQILCIFFNPFVNDDYYADKTIVTDAFESCLTVLQVLSVNIVYISICLKRKNIANSINKLIKLDSSMLEINKYYKIDTSFNVILLLITYVIIGIGIYVSFVIGFPQNLGYLVHITGTNILNWFIIEYVIILEILIGRIASLNELIVKIGGRTFEYEEYIFFKSRLRLLNVDITQLTSIRRAIKIIHTISSFTANLFSFPLLAIILYDTGVIIYSAYYLIIPFISETSEQTLATTISTGLLLLLRFSPIIMLAKMVENFNEEMNRTGDLIHKIMSRSILDDELQEELRQFAWESLDNDVDFTSCGVFQLDGTLPFSIFGTLVTYLVILCQLN